MERKQMHGHLAMFGANVMWGLMAPIAKMVMAGAIITPLLLGDFRMIGAAALFWIASAFMPWQHVPALDLLRLAGAAMLGIVFNQGCYLFGVGFSTPSDATVITTTMPMWVMVLSALILKEPITWKKAMGIVLGASGALLLVFNSASRGTASGSNPVLGDLLVLTAQFSYALYLTLYKNFISKYSLFTLMRWMFTFASIAILIPSLPSLAELHWSEVSSTEWYGIAFVVCCGTFLAYIGVMIGQKSLRPTLVGMYNYVQPIVASIVGICLGLDTFTPLKVMAIVLVFSGVWLVTISKARPQGPAPVDGIDN
jgi:drug/metabolite transporter (DMT)-like permease